MTQVPVRTSAALAMVPKLPDYVKTAVYTGAAERGTLPAGAFAGRDRRYPAHTKAAAYVSALEYWAGAERIPAVEAGLRKAAGLFGIGPDIDDIPSRVGPATEKRASAEADFALNFDDGGERVHLFPLRTGAELLKSAGALEATRQRTTYPMRREAARNLLARAGELGLTLPNYVSKAAGVGPVTYGAARRGVADRAAVAPPHRRELYRKLAASLDGGDDDTVMADPQDLTELLDLADRAAGLHVKYARGLETPEELCYRGEVPSALTMRLSKGRLPVGEVKSAGLTLDDLAPLGDRFVEAVRTPFRPLDRSPGIDFAKLAVAAENLNDHDSRMLAGIVRGRMRGDDK